MDHKQDAIQQDHSGAASHEHMAYNLWHILGNNVFILFSGWNALASMAPCPSRRRLLEIVHITEVSELSNPE